MVCVFRYSFFVDTLRSPLFATYFFRLKQVRRLPVVVAPGDGHRTPYAARNEVDFFSRQGNLILC